MKCPDCGGKKLRSNILLPGSPTECKNCGHQAPWDEFKEGDDQ